jgi:hypothetical protein
LNGVSILRVLEPAILGVFEGIGFFDASHIGRSGLVDPLILLLNNL